MTLARNSRPQDRTGAVGPSQRQLKAGELIRRALADLLSRGDIHDEALADAVVTVPEVRCSPDLRNATVYVMPLGGHNTANVISALARHNKYIRGEIARAVNLKYAPQLSYKADETFDEAEKVGALLNSPVVKRDLESNVDE